MSSESPRLFELHEGTSDKFWEISLDGLSHTVRYGRVGTDGQSKTKEFDSEEKARASYDKLIKQKTGKGYAEVSSVENSRQEKMQSFKAAAKAREPFIQAILEEPDEIAPYMVFADWLEGQGDVQAELIRIQWQLEDENTSAADRKKLTAREKALRKTHETEWLGDLAEELINQKCPEGLIWGNEKLYQWDLARGFLDSLHVRYLLPSFAKTLKQSPLARMLRRLSIEDPSDAYSLEETDEYGDSDWDEDEAPSLKMLNGTAFPNLRTFILTEDDQCHIQAPSVQNLLKQMPRLETLQLDAHSLNLEAIFKLKLPELRSLTVQHTADRYPLEVLAGNKSLGNLESLFIWPHALDFDDEPYLDLEGFRALCRSTHLKSLKEITLQLTHFGDEGATELANSALLPQLRKLSLTNGNFTDESLDALCAANLGHLEELELSGQYFSKEGVTRLKQTFPKVKADDQYSGDPDDEREHLWMGDME